MEGIPLALDVERSPILELLVIGNLECIVKFIHLKQNKIFQNIWCAIKIFSVKANKREFIQANMIIPVDCQLNCLKMYT